MAGRWPRRPRFNPRPVHVRFLVDEVILWQVLLSVFFNVNFIHFPCNYIFVCFWRDSPRWAGVSSFTRFPFHTRHITVGKTPLDDWSARLRDLCLTTHNTHNKHPCPRWDSNPQSQQASGRRPTPYTARPLGPAGNCFTFTKFITNLYYTIYFWLVLRHVSAWLHRPSSGNSLWHASFASTYLLRVPTYNYSRCWSKLWLTYS